MREAELCVTPIRVCTSVATSSATEVMQVSQARFCGTIALTILAFVLASGCNDVATIWSQEVPSPDGRWVATAQTVQGGGPGTAFLDTSVYVKQKSKAPTKVLGFDQQSARVVNLKMEWVTSTHLDVTYGLSEPSGRVSLYLQVVKIAGIEVTAHEVLSPPSKIPR